MPTSNPVPTLKDDSTVPADDEDSSDSESMPSLETLHGSRDIAAERDYVGAQKEGCERFSDSD
ncbi:UNVERIFIED_CONTAM: hypothetical protein Slati_2391000 [Sesamum latifolium]|uniref:Uncharacterized protein n=1 Tax=Sesamum latifolium TaxID=2727402 RepID=A0AAW2WFZ0_9LAMI